MFESYLFQSQIKHYISFHLDEKKALLTHAGRLFDPMVMVVTQKPIIDNLFKFGSVHILLLWISRWYLFPWYSYGICISTHSPSLSASHLALHHHIQKASFQHTEAWTPLHEHWHVVCCWSVCGQGWWNI